MSDRFDDLPDVVYVHRIAAIKWPLLWQCFGGRALRPLPASGALPRDACVVTWGATPLPEGVEPAIVLRLEDGFLRSVGLGVDLVRPVSWVVDRSGLHFDPSRPSDLEMLLAGRSFSAADLVRAARIRQRVVDAGLTKYNIAGQRWTRPAHARRVLLVAGQVPTDAALHCAGSGLTNVDLLRRARAYAPDAYLVYKVHPDLLAGMRTDAQAHVDLSTLCDEVVGSVDLHDLLTQVDEVHVVSSLTGFEALLRGCTVVCHGRPFYSGWGLTVDLSPASARRGVALTLDALVAGALIHYPVYLSRQFRGRIEAEEAIDALVRWREAGGGRPVWWRPVYRRALRRIVGVR